MTGNSGIKTSVPNRPRHHNRLSAVSAIIAGIVLIVVGVIGQTTEAARSAICNSGFGLYGQEVSGKGAVDCGVATFIETMGGVFKYMGIIAMVGGAIWVIVLMIDAGSAGRTS